jgi:hypothetical protein
LPKASILKGEIVGQASLPAFYAHGNRERLPYKPGVRFANRWRQKKPDKKILKKVLAREIVI